MKKAFFSFILFLFISQASIGQEDFSAKQISQISEIMKEVMAMSQKNNAVIAFEFQITNGEYSLKNPIVQKDNNWVSDYAKNTIQNMYDGFRKDFVIINFTNTDILASDNEEPVPLGNGAIACEALCEYSRENSRKGPREITPETGCYKIFYLP